MQQKRLFLIINPISGTRNKRGLDKYVIRRMQGSGVDVDVAWTTCRGDATRLAKKAVDEGYDIVVAAGGDGTINETATALCGTDVAFGIIPCGSGNGLARHLGIPGDIKAAVEILRRGNVTACDYGTVNDHPFFCTFGMGFDAAVSDKFARQNRRGKLSYYKSTFQEYMTYRPEEYKICIDGKEITDEAWLIAVCNASQYGNNAYIAPAASICDGKLDITVMHSGNLLNTARLGIDLMAGSLNRNARIDSFKITEATIRRNSEGPIHIDGEPMIFPDTLVVKCHPQSLKIITPGKPEHIRPLITPLASMAMDCWYAIKRIFVRM